MDVLKIILYLLAVITSFACAVFLLRGYAEKRMRLLLWAGLCFVGLTVSNIVLFIDLAVLPTIDLRLARLAPALIGMLLLLYGLIWDSE